ncbi:MAG: LamG-like jellyroll fold domain-containing protein [Schlesneria sp.]
MACITIIDESGHSGFATYRLYCATTPTNLGRDQPLYAASVQNGTIEVNGVLIDITVYFFVTNGVCTIALRSSRLGITENSYGASRIVDANARNGGFCFTLGMDGLGYTKFNVSGAGHSYEIRLAADKATPINGRPVCVDEFGNIVPDDDPIKNACCNCDCICTCMCATVASTNYGWSGTACLYNGAWRFSNGVTVTIGPLDGLDEAYLISCWSMDQAAYASRLDSYGGNNLEDVSGIPNTSIAVINKAANFGGYGLLSSNSSGLSLSGVGFTVGCWVNFQDLTGTKGNQTIIAKTLGNGLDGFSWKIWYDNSAHRITFSASDGTAIHDVRADVIGLPTINHYYFISAKIDTVAKTMSIRIAAGTANTIPFTGKIPLTYGLFCVGGQDGTNPEYLWGYVDQIAIYKNKKDTDWESLLYNNGSGRACNDDDQCYLKLTNAGPFKFSGSTPGPVLLDKITNPCPRPIGVWAFTEAANTTVPYDHPVGISVRCSSCAPACIVNLPSCCSTGRTQFPMSLQVAISNTCTACPTATTSLMWDGVNNYWYGTVDICGRLTSLKIACPFTTLVINDGICISNASPTCPTATCDPILAVFTVGTAGIGCCRPADPTGTTLTITIYES